MHKSRLGTNIVDCKTDDLGREANFWSAALGSTPGKSDEAILPERHGSIEHPSKQIKCSSTTTQRTTEKNVKLPNT